MEALLFVTAALGLTFFGHLGQVYQPSSPLWQPLATWLVLFAPLLLLMGRGWPTALAVLGGTVWCVWEYFGAMTSNGMARDSEYLWQVWLGTVIGLPVVLALAAASLRAQSQRTDFWRRLEQLALAYAVAGASLACALASGSDMATAHVVITISPFKATTGIRSRASHCYNATGVGRMARDQAGSAGYGRPNSPTTSPSPAPALTWRVVAAPPRRCGCAGGHRVGRKSPG